MVQCVGYPKSIVSIWDGKRIDPDGFVSRALEAILNQLGDYR